MQYPISPEANKIKETSSTHNYVATNVERKPLMTPQLDIENKLRTHFPILFELLGKNSVDWRTIEKSYMRKFEEYQARFLRTNSTFRIPTSFYNIVSSAIDKEEQAIRLLDYIQKLFEELSSILDTGEKILIKASIYGFLTNMDLKYLNFLGELAVLHRLKKTSLLKLIGTEVPLDPMNKNGSKIDFLILNSQTDKQELVEVVNIHLAERNISSNEKIKILLSQKIGEKLLKKGLNRQGSFFLVPVLWGQWDEIKVIREYYSIHKPIFPNTIIPSCFVTFTDAKGASVHRFGTIDTIFNNSTV